jgi:class 3 adenylate cyclase
VEDPKVSAWLGALGLGQYAAAFAEAEVDFETLHELTSGDLREIGVDAVGPRRRLESAITRLRGERATSAGSPEFIGARRHLTILFCDVVGSTALSQRFDAEQMSVMFRDYYGVVSRVLERSGGHEANRLGDGSFIFFGYPHAREHAALQAVLTADQILDETRRLVRDPGGDPIRVRAGLASGMVVLNHADPTNVFGETANIAARVQSLAEPGEIVIADSTRQLLRGHVRVEPRGRHSLKGIEDPMEVWTVLPGEAPAPAGTDRGVTPPLVGRDRELDALTELWDDVRAGRGRCAYVCGEAGIGKSRLIADFAERVSAQGDPQRIFSCSSEFVDSPFFPFLREARGADADSQLVDAELTSAMREPERKEPLNLIRDRREALIAGFMRRALAPDAGMPMLLCFEDAHWSDPSSTEVLTRLRDAIIRRPVLLIITGRDPEGIPGIVADVNLLLRPLTVEDSRRIVATMIGRRGVSTPEQVIAEIADRADGVPFFAEELALSFAQATVARSGAVASVADVPASLQEALQYRVDVLEVGSEVLELAAVFGRELPMDLLEALVPSQRAREAALDELSAAGLLGVATSAFADAVIFKHQLVLEYVYDTIMRQRRVTLHTRVADVLAQRPDTGPETRAYHEERAGRGETAARCWAEAGKRAAFRSADAEAATYFRRALALLPEFAGAPAAEEFEVEVLLAFLPALMGSDGYISAATGSVNRVVELTTKRSLPDQAFNAMFLRWLDQLARGNIDLAHGLGLEMGPLAEQFSNDIASLLIDRMMGTTHMFRGELAAASEALERFARRYEPALHAGTLSEYGATDNHTTVQCCRICVSVLMGRLEDARRLQQETVAEAEQLGRVHNLCHVLAYGGAIGSALQQDWTAMARYLHQLNELAGPHELPFWEAAVSFLRGIEAAHEGDPIRGRAIFDVGADWFTRNGSGFLLPTFRVLFASATAASAMHDSSDDAVANEATRNNPDELVRMDAGLNGGERWVRSELLRLRAVEALRDGYAQSAATVLEQAVTLAREQGAELLAVRAASMLGSLAAQRSG